MSHLLLKERELNSDLFANGQYIPLKVTGKFKEHIMAYSRSLKNIWYVVVIPLYSSLIHENTEPDWGDTRIELPGLAPRTWTSISKIEKFYSDDHLRVSDVLKIGLPVVLKGVIEESKRKAGVLLHITSLPGRYGTGDVGSKAYEFIDFLKKSGQSYWQILPINPVTGGSNYSPYSTYSAFAGNVLLIDPEWLEKHHLVSTESLVSYKFSNSRKTEFAKAEEFRLKLIDEAFLTFIGNDMPFLKSKFDSFCEREKYWLDDFALYLILKKGFKEKSWFKWPKRIRDRESEELDLLRKAHYDELEKAKFSQFLFFTQWQELRDYSMKNGIRIIGDMAFYVSYESVDVWQNPEVFKLDRNKKMMASGGAPPDYFSKTGQFWNMPVYNWEKIKNDDYSWWRGRILRNMQWYDIVRFDHFRGFSGFWEVKATEKTAVNGRWVDGPGDELFLRLKKDFHEMPFIAEDLGDIDNKVYRLRDKFGLPGMKVLQFAFNDTFEKSIHLPHNFTANCVVYTGTHDNNTTRGWFEKELDTFWKKRLLDYINREVSGETIQEEFIRLAYASVAFIAIIPMQDILGSDNSERFNNPGGSKDSWKWKLESMDRVTEKTDYLVRLVKTYWRF
jgi:4-alpha-glucanotransferase